MNNCFNELSFSGSFYGMELGRGCPVWGLEIVLIHPTPPPSNFHKFELDKVDKEKEMKAVEV